MGEEELEADADRIRNLALNDFVAPARAEGRKFVTIVARDIHDRLGLNAAHANVCQALGGRKFQELASVPPPKMEGPMASSTTTFTYELDGGTIGDRELLHFFDSCDYFRTRRVRWSDEQTSSFCAMARAVHGLGLDWYRTNIPQIRFGRKDGNADRAEATLASFDASPARIRFTHSSGELGLEGSFLCNETDRVAFIRLLEEKRDAIANWRPPVPPREALGLLMTTVRMSARQTRARILPTQQKAGLAFGSRRPWYLVVLIDWRANTPWGRRSGHRKSRRTAGRSMHQ